MPKYDFPVVENMSRHAREHPRERTNARLSRQENARNLIKPGLAYRSVGIAQTLVHQLVLRAHIELAPREVEAEENVADPLLL